MATNDRNQNFIKCVAYGLRTKRCVMDVESVGVYARKLAEVFDFPKDRAKRLVPDIHEELSSYFEQRIINEAAENAIRAKAEADTEACLKFVRPLAGIYAWQGDVHKAAERVADEVNVRSAMREVLGSPMKMAYASAVARDLGLKN